MSRSATAERRRPPAAHSHFAALMRWSARGCVATLGLVFLVLPSPPLCAQNAPPGGPLWHGQNGDMSPLGGDSGSPEMQIKRLQALNAERQKALVSDTNKLLKLTAELNAQINGSHPGSLTEEQLRMVGEIEKLARSVRDKMSMAIGGIQQMGPQPPSVIPPGLP